MKIILIGAPGSGKGTVGKRLSKEFNIPEISVGNIFREHMANKTELGKKIYDVMQSGNLVPDKIVMQVVAERLSQNDCKNGFILDGFPRTVQQAKMFQKICKPDFIFNLNVAVCELKKRLLLRGRADDTEKVIKERLSVHKKEFAPIKEFYGKSLITIKANRTKKEVYDTIKSIIKENQKEAER